MYSVNVFLDKTPNLTQKQIDDFREQICKKGALTKGAPVSEWNDCFELSELETFLKKLLAKK